ncbi:NUDIX hydrolase [Pseudooceanicola sp.]|uniref:NUDIX hydrolase n=1 Tax=Pseudooceanicola sp. TaxID=1914328 RepID=UPI004058FBEE
MDYDRPFDGAKLALFLGADLLVIRRDVDKPIPWPGFLDFPGGGRERGESPAACVLRETREETGLVVAPADISWRGYFVRPNRVWFFAAHLSPRRIDEVRFGGEGQGWQMMPPGRYIADDMAIPHFRERLKLVIGAAGG